MTKEKAFRIVENEIRNLDIIRVVETLDSFMFITNLKGEKEMIPDMPIYEVLKSNGKMQLAHPLDFRKKDPYETLTKMNKGKTVYIKE